MNRLELLQKETLADLYPNDTGYQLTEARLEELITHIYSQAVNDCSEIITRARSESNVDLRSLVSRMKSLI